jgi:hypothetical protein
VIDAGRDLTCPALTPTDVKHSRHEERRALTEAVLSLPVPTPSTFPVRTSATTTPAVPVRAAGDNRVERLLRNERRRGTASSHAAHPLSSSVSLFRPAR